MRKPVKGLVKKGGQQVPLRVPDRETSFEPRLVTLMDVLGFKHQIKTHGARDVGERYERVLGNAQMAWSDIVPPFRTGDKGPKDFGALTIFSDTIIFLSLGDTDEHILRAYYGSWRLMQLLVGQAFPMRGAICYADVSISPFTVVSDGLVQANEMEHSQEWMGISVSAEAAARIRTAAANITDLGPFVDRTLVDYDVPHKN